MSSSVKVRVRMYRQGLGDCFLLTFTSRDDESKKPVSVLIDCGVDWNTKGGSKEIRRVAEQIGEETDDTLDLLVVTHEHWDHVSGFVRAKAAFEAMAVKQVWLAWTEDPDDEFAKSLKAERSLAFDAIALGSRQLIQNRAGLEADRQALAATGEETERVLSFYGCGDSAKLGFSKTSDEAMDFVSSLKTDDDYCSPGGGPESLNSLPGVRFYILGPPKNDALLKKMNPTASEPETYELGSVFGEHRSFFASLQTLGAGEDPSGVPELLSATEISRLRNYPFNENKRIDKNDRRTRELFERSYFDDEQSWRRRIDYDWLIAVSDLALQLDNAVNNTSLVLAIELVDSGKVLLFPGDAQVGNWLSWQELSWTLPSGETVTGDDLLARTVLYKVGHHGSHNATLKEEGLEKMSSPDLVAMIPVDEKYADKTKGWQMPHEPLYVRLLARTSGRVLRLDRAWPTDDSEKPEGLSNARWQRFKNAVTINDLYIDYVV